MSNHDKGVYHLQTKITHYTYRFYVCVSPWKQHASERQMNDTPFLFAVRANFLLDITGDCRWINACYCWNHNYMANCHQARFADLTVQVEKKREDFPTNYLPNWHTCISNHATPHYHTLQT